MWEKYVEAGSVPEIIRDRGKLSPRYIPEELPHRESQIEALKSLYMGSLEKPTRPFLQICQVIGPVGTGKTASCIRFGSAFEAESKRRGIDLSHVYVNLKIHGASRQILYGHIAGKVAQKLYSRGLGANELLYGMLRYLDREHKFLLITLDEIDYYVRHVRDQVIYDLTRLNEAYSDGALNVFGIVFTARSTEFHGQLERAELSTLGRTFMEFPAYTSTQLFDILQHRAQEALNRGAYTDEILEYIADVTASPPVNGDVRYALDLLLFSGNLAEGRGHDAIMPEDVRRVHGETYPHVTSEDIANLPEEERVALMGVVRALQIARDPYVTLKNIREMYKVVCEGLGEKPSKEVEALVQDLHDRGIIEIRKLTKIGMTGAPAQELDKFLSNLMDRVRGTYP
ncbi:MAG: Cdc6/Cdc18 family protein [Candidatus Geothermarchaeales archaeon]